MTVISGMKFNETSGAIVSDEQASYGYRKSDIATKLTPLTSIDNQVRAILGGVGAADVLFDATQQIAQQAKSNSFGNSLELASLVSQIMEYVKSSYIDGYLRDKYRLKEKDFQNGTLAVSKDTRVPIEPSLMQQYNQLISGQSELSQMLNNEFLILASDTQGLQLFQATMILANPMQVSRPYETAGTGADTADTELYAFFENMPREKRADINPVRGISALLNATDRAIVRNQMVGGTPLIGIIRGNEIIMPEEKSCKLGVEIVKGEKRGFLEQGFAYAALGELLFKKGSFEAVENEMWQNANKLGQQENLNRFLRGYKING